MSRLVALSLAIGLLAAVALAALPIVPVEEGALEGAVLCGFALGCVVLRAGSVRWTAQPQRWAAVPAAYLGLGGLALAVSGSGGQAVLSWVWPPTLLLLVGWMIRRVRRDLGSRSGRIQLYVAFTVLALGAVGGGYATVRDATGSIPMPAASRLIDVDGHRMYLSCTGSGSPTVVLEPGAGGTSAQLGWIAPAVAGTTRVCVYDRVGRGWSETDGRAQDGARIAQDLHTLLHRAGEQAPYVLAGHSFGGLYVRTFAARYPDEVGGLVLIDSTAATTPARSVVPSPEAADGGAARFAAVTSLLARTGVARVYSDLDFGSLPPQARDEVRAALADPRWIRSTVEEYLRGGVSASEAAALHDFGDKPLFVLTAGEGHPAAWNTAQTEMAGLSTNSAHQVVAGATHPDLVVEKRYAAATSRAVLAVVEAVRTDRPLR